jgi:hypothetical protein
VNALYNEQLMISGYSSALEPLQRVLDKLKNGEQLTFEEQCVSVVACASFSNGHKVTQEYFDRIQANQPIELHSIFELFFKSYPTNFQLSLSEVGAASCGLNLDGTERPVTQEQLKESVICQTYIIRKFGTAEVKIGKSIRIKKRLRTLETQTGYKLEVLALIPKDIESMLHKQFSEFRTIGEWFNDSKGLIAAFAKKQTVQVAI